MFKKIFEYAGPYKKNMYVATVVVLVSVLMGVLPFVLAYQVIAPLVMGESIEASLSFARGSCLGVSGAASPFLWLGAESFSQSRLRHAAPSADGTSKTV